MWNNKNTYAIEHNERSQYGDGPTMTCHTLFCVLILEGTIEWRFAFDFIFNMRIFAFSHLLWGISKHIKVALSQHHPFLLVYVCFSSSTICSFPSISSNIVAPFCWIYRLFLLIYTMNLLWICFSLWLGVTKQVEPVRSTHLTCGVNRSTCYCYIFNKYFCYLIWYFLL